MMLRIIHGKLKPGTWDSYERAYKDVLRQVYGMLLERMRNALSAVTGFIEPCLPSPAARAAAGDAGDQISKQRIVCGVCPHGLVTGWDASNFFAGG